MGKVEGQCLFTCMSAAIKSCATYCAQTLKSITAVAASREKLGLPTPAMARGISRQDIIYKLVRSRTRRNSNPQALTQLGSAECGYLSTHDPPSESISNRSRRLNVDHRNHHGFTCNPDQSITTRRYLNAAVSSDLETKSPAIRNI